MKVVPYQCRVPGSDEDMHLFIVLDDDNQVQNCTVGVKDLPNMQMKFLTLDSDFFWILLGDVAKEAYDYALEN